MMPSILVLRVGPGRGFPFFIPVFLVWPFVGLAALGMLVVGSLVPARSAAARALAAGWMALRLLGQLRGTKIDVHETKGSRIYMHFI